MKATEPVRSLSETRQAEVLAEGVRQMFENVRSAISLLMLLYTVPVLLLWTRIDHITLLAWGAFVQLGPALRYVLIRRYFAQNQPVGETRRWANAMAFTSLIDGLAWGIAGLIFLIPDSLPYQIFLTVMIVGVPAGSIFFSAPWPRTNFAFAIPAVSLTALGWISRGGDTGMGTAISLMVYLAILHLIMKMANQEVMRSIGLRFENLDLVEQLQVEKNAAERAREVAEQANVAKSKFLAAASHDLRQPLHALGLFTTALNDRIRNPEALNIVENINRCVSALGSLFEALLDISRLDAGVIEPRRAHFPLHTVLNRLAVEYQPQAANKGLAFEIVDSEIILNSDPVLVDRILRNLITNAIRYTAKGGIWISAQREGGTVEIDVRDSGPGIPEDKHEQIFREFVQLANPERDRDKGLGLGLAIVRRLATLLDGAVTVESAPGSGSCFRVRLPGGDASAVAATHEDQPTFPARPFAGWLVVVIDDEQTVSNAMQVLLDGWGCATVAAEDAIGAMRAIRSTDQLPDMIIADYRLRDGVTGAQVIRSLQAEFGPIPALIITGDTAPERLQEAVASGFPLLHKPVQPGKLRAVLANRQRAAKGNR